MVVGVIRNIIFVKNLKQNMRKLVFWKSVNETCSFYFEPLSGSGRPGYMLMCPIRMNYIFSICIKDRLLSTQNYNKISKWKEENGY